ncbi:MAG: hypothetical protein ABSC87_06220 [Halobacteriota archaeon]|jgi:hypothetical protein
MAFESLNPVQRFVYSLFVLFLVTILVLIVFSLYSLEIFAMVIIIEFLFVVQLTKPAHFHALWRKNISFFVLLSFILLILIIFLSTPALFK